MGRHTDSLTQTGTIPPPNKGKPAGNRRLSAENHWGGDIVERIKNLNLYQKGIVLLLALLFVGFTVAYSVAS